MKYKNIIEKFINLHICKKEQKQYTLLQQTAFKKEELRVFKEIDKLNLSFKTFNTLSFICGDYVDNYLTKSLNDALNLCNKLIIENEVKK